MMCLRFIISGISIITIAVQPPHIYTSTSAQILAVPRKKNRLVSSLSLTIAILLVLAILTLSVLLQIGILLALAVLLALAMLLV